MEIREIAVSELPRYESISIRFLVKERLDLEALPSIIAIPVEPWWKDYDDCQEDRPTELAVRFDFTNWAIFVASVDDEYVGGLIVARDCPGCEVLENRSDLAVIYDVRVANSLRGTGLGRELFSCARLWAIEKGCTELRVETQDVNVPACRFYAAMGCEIFRFDSTFYGPDCDEAMILWGRRLTRSTPP